MHTRGLGYTTWLVRSMQCACACAPGRHTVEVCRGSPLCLVSSCPPSRVSEAAALPHQFPNPGQSKIAAGRPAVEPWNKLMSFAQCSTTSLPRDVPLAWRFVLCRGVDGVLGRVWQVAHRPAAHKPRGTHHQQLLLPFLLRLIRRALASHHSVGETRKEVGIM
jgi:hypothetical protein